MQDRPRLVTKRRNFLILIGVGVFDMTIIGRLFTIQGFNAAHLKTLADDIHFRDIPLAPFRGNITDREGRLLAGSHHVYSLYAVPMETRGRRSQEAILVASLVNVPLDRVLRRLRRNQGFVWLKRHLTRTEMQAVKTQLSALPGVHLITEAVRYYPEGFLLGPVLGFSGIDNQGLAGVELEYNRDLTGKPGKIEEEYDVVGRRLEYGDQRVVPSRPGDSLRLSVDLNMQWMAERACERAMASTGAKSVSVLVMHPRTGGILAMAQRPSIDPNYFREYGTKDYRVLAVSDAIPPGSIFKPVTLASALEAGTTHPSSGFFCPGFKIVFGRRINCWRPEGHGAESLAQVVMNSCNVGFMELGLGLGMERFYQALDRFQINGVSHIDLPGEAKGIMPRQARATLLDLAVMAFGQTLTVTPINLLNAIAAIANGGELLKPHVVEKILSADGRVMESRDREVVRRVISPEVSRMVQEMMTGVVSRGTGKQAQVPGYRVAGKTGTAQKVIAGRVVKGVYIASFVGFAPVPNPEVAIMVNVDEPVGAFYGGQVAAPIFGRVMRDILRYWKIPPTHPVRRPKFGELAMVPDLVDLDPATAENDAEASGFPVQFTGSGDFVVAQSVEYGGWQMAGTLLTLTLGTHSRIYLEWVTVPNFRGLTSARSRNLAFDVGLNVQVRGQGDRVQMQSIGPGTQVKSGTSVWLDMA